MKNALLTLLYHFSVCEISFKTAVAVMLKCPCFYFCVWALERTTVEIINKLRSSNLRCRKSLIDDFWVIEKHFVNTEIFLKHKIIHL